jgi:ATP-dependent Zn protease
MRVQLRGVIYFVVILVVVGAIYVFSKTAPDPGADAQERSYAQLVKDAQGGNILSSNLTRGGTVVYWADSSGGQFKTFIDPQVTRIDPDLAVKMHLSVTPQSSGSVLLSLLPNILFLALIGSFMWFMVRQSKLMSEAKRRRLAAPGDADIDGTTLG